MSNYWQSKTIKLRALEASDLDFFIALNQDTQRSQFIDWLRPPRSTIAIEHWLKEKAQQNMQDFQYQWMIESLEGQTVGSIVTHSCDSRAGTFSYALDVLNKFQRRGYASEAIKLILNYYFQELRFQKVTVAVHSNNVASIELHQHLGFQHEGRHRRMVFSEGTYYDLEWFGLTTEEYFQSQNALKL
ncbi:MAG: GNAT family protein [Deinococcota bacterium]